MIKGYWEFLKLFPGFSNITLEHIESSEIGFMMVISRTIERWGFTEELLKPDAIKMHYTITVSVRKEIIKEEDINETKPK